MNLGGYVLIHVQAACALDSLGADTLRLIGATAGGNEKLAARTSWITPDIRRYRPESL
jgi:hypothetical protein